MALDYGDKTIGVAVSDPLGILALGVETIRRSDPISLKQSITRLRELINQYDINEILLGYPKNLNNTEGARCEKTKQFKKKLEKHFSGLPVILWDERLSTVGAMRNLNTLSYGKKGQIIDKMAAVFFLQGYLDWKKVNLKEVNNTMSNFDDENLDGMDMDADEEYEIITMKDENGEEVDFVILDAKELNEKTYLLVIEEEFIDNEDADASIIKSVTTDGDDEVYEFIEDDEEFDKIAGLFQEDSDDFDIEF
jgi:putative Holliday junction resolvase